MMNELDNIPSLKPEKPVKIYRGMLWSSKYSFEKNGEGRKFLKAIRKGTDVIDYTDENPSSWTTDIGVAKGFATARPSDTQFGATLNWLYQQQAGNKIDGELGAIVMILAQPEDVIAMLDKVNNKMSTKFAPEDEVILREGKYTAKIVALYDKKLGQVDPKTYFNEDSGDWSELKSAYVEMGEKWMPLADQILNANEGRDYRYMHGNGSAFDPKTAKVLLPLEDKIDKAFDSLFDYIKKLDFDREMPSKTTDDDLRSMMILRDSGFKYVTIKNKEGRFYKYDNVDSLKKDIKSYLWYGKPDDEISKFLKDNDVIKRDLSYYKKDNQEQYKAAMYRNLLEAAGEKTDGDVMKDGQALAERVELINNELYWINKAYNALEEAERKMAA